MAAHDADLESSLLSDQLIADALDAGLAVVAQEGYTRPPQQPLQGGPVVGPKDVPAKPGDYVHLRTRSAGKLLEEVTGYVLSCVAVDANRWQLVYERLDGAWEPDAPVFIARTSGDAHADTGIAWVRTVERVSDATGPAAVRSWRNRVVLDPVAALQDLGREVNEERVDGLTAFRRAGEVAEMLASRLAVGTPRNLTVVVYSDDLSLSERWRFEATPDEARTKAYNLARLGAGHVEVYTEDSRLLAAYARDGCGYPRVDARWEGERCVVRLLRDASNTPETICEVFGPSDGSKMLRARTLLTCLSSPATASRLVMHGEITADHARKEGKQ